MTNVLYREYLAEEKLPTIWCPGCGNGTVLRALLQAFAALKLDPRKTVAVSGIGCWGWADDYLRVNAFHGTHGRALAFATGIALANPDLTVIALMGDGDGATIGGNHLIHAARRNVNVTALVANNFNYGMTGGQYSGTTPTDSITATSFLGHMEEGFDLCALAAAAGAPYVARGTVAEPGKLAALIEGGLARRGFSFVEALSPCPTHFGRFNGAKTPWEMLEELKSTPLPLGILTDREKEDYGTRYARTAEREREEGSS
ncbi:MAG: 2-oxoacid:ferredoxin oxidoreductase subunit beta [Synergistaceae bacterium]|nr:2-oxoacid:ferredoxin oxidoreductase subunit beta [Synergistaceae bacterium]